MLIVKPDPNNDNCEQKTLNAFLDDTPCGYVRFRLNGYIVVITEFLPLLSGRGEDDELYPVADTVIRALGSWALNRSCYYLECHEPMLYPTLGCLRFEQKDGVMKSDLSKILRQCH